MIPTFDISSLLGPPSRLRDETDRRVMSAACDVGFLTISGLPGDVPQGAAVRAELLRVFSLPEPAKRALWRRKFDPARPNVYHGWFPLQNGAMTYKEGIDLGPDVADPDIAVPVLRRDVVQRPPGADVAPAGIDGDHRAAVGPLHHRVVDRA